MTNYSPNDIRRMYGLDETPIEFATGGPIPPGTTLFEPTDCYYSAAHDGELISPDAKFTRGQADALDRLAPEQVERFASRVEREFLGNLDHWQPIGIVQQDQR